MSCITSVKTGVNLATGAASTNAAIPTASSGTVPFKVRVSATAAAAIKVGTSSGVTAVAGDLMVQPGDAVVLNIPRGCTHIAAIQISAAGVVNVAPLEDA